jgi:ketosteroid isomerase-like protein
MRHLIVFIPFASLLTAMGSLALAADAARSRDVEAITAIERSMAAAQDANGVTRTWDDDVIWYDLQGAEVVGKKAAYDLTAKQFEAITNLRTKILRMTVKVEGTMGYAHSVQEFISDVKGGGSPLDFIFRETDIFIKKAGHWHLVHQHLSVPVDLATGKAVLTNQDTSRQATK